MATIESLSENYAQYLVLNQNDPRVVKELAKRINRITNTNTGNYLSNDDKERILNYIQSKVSPSRKLPDGRFLAQESHDSSKLIELIQLVRQEVKK